MTRRQGTTGIRSRVVSVVTAQLLIFLARPAHAQDITVLVYALVPPVVLAPFGIALARWLWLGRSSPPRARLVPLFIASAFEVFLWIALIASVLVLMTGDWNARALFGPPVLCVALWMMSRIWIDPSHKAARWLFIASAPLVLTLLAAATWLVLSRWEF